MLKRLNTYFQDTWQESTAVDSRMAKGRNILFLFKLRSQFSTGLHKWVQTVKDGSRFEKNGRRRMRVASWRESHLGAHLVQSGGNVFGGRVAAKYVTLQHLRQIVPGHVGKIPAGQSTEIWNGRSYYRSIIGQNCVNIFKTKGKKKKLWVYLSLFVWAKSSMEEKYKR